MKLVGVGLEHLEEQGAGQWALLQSAHLLQLPGQDSSKSFKGHLGGVTAALMDGSSKGEHQYFFLNSNPFKSCVCEICSSEEGTENRVGSCWGF